jgi:hypothetical protein
MRMPPRLLLGLAALCLWQAPALADPALWVLRDADSTIYLFGTVHTMKPGVNWHTADIDAAFSASQELWVEEVGDEDQELMKQLIMRYGVDPAHPLSSKLTPEQQQKLADAIKSANLPAPIINQMRPWMAAVELSVVPLMQAGYDPDQGVDRALRMEAAAVGKPVKSFETPEGQIRIFADLPPAVELSALTESLQEIDEGPNSIKKLVDDWLAGNVDALDADISADMRGGSPALYKAVFLDRNASWTRRIEQMLAGKGTIFIAVGAGHLVGKDSVIAALQRDGHQVTRE